MISLPPKDVELCSSYDTVLVISQGLVVSFRTHDQEIRDQSLALVLLCTYIHSLNSLKCYVLVFAPIERSSPGTEIDGFTNGSR